MMAEKQLDSAYRCPICGCAKTRFDRSLSDHYDLYACAICGGRFCDPFAAPLPEFYALASDLASQSRHSGPAGWYPSHPTRQSEVFRNGEGRILLDIGCGNGAFAEFAASRGYQVVGLDVDSTSIAIARSRNIPGAEFHCASLDEFCRPTAAKSQFDVVTMFEMLEHLDRPMETLGTVKRLLHRGGLLVGSLPNIERLLMWRLNMDYEMPPYHLTYWTVESWTKFLQQFFDLEVLSCEANIYYGYLSDVLLTRYRLSRLTRNLIIRLLFPVEVRLERRFRMGASFYFEARCHSAHSQDSLMELQHPINPHQTDLVNERVGSSQ